MPITLALTLTSLGALVGLAHVLREFALNYRHIKLGRRNGMSREVARMLVVLLSTMVATTAVLFVGGVGLLVGFRPALWLVAAIPLIKMYAAVFVVRSLRRQVRLYREALGISS